MIVGRVINGEYVRFTDGAAKQDDRHRSKKDYFKGVAPSDLSRLDERQLYTAAERLHESVISGVGTASERQGASEALHEVYRERRRRQSTIR